jgi:hypothetical protein
VRPELRELRNWIYNDWVEIYSRDSFHGPVTDKRWQSKLKSFCWNIILNIIFGDFTTTIGGFIIKNTQCFSTYSDNNDIKLTFTSKDKTIQKTITAGQDDNNASII